MKLDQIYLCTHKKIEVLWHVTNKECKILTYGASILLIRYSRKNGGVLTSN